MTETDAGAPTILFYGKWDTCDRERVESAVLRYESQSAHPADGDGRPWICNHSTSLTRHVYVASPRSVTEVFVADSIDELVGRLDRRRGNASLDLLSV